MHAYERKQMCIYICIYIYAYMYIHVGVCVHVPIEHDFNRNFGLFHKIHAHRIITACFPMCNGDALYIFLHVVWLYVHMCSKYLP